MDRYILTRVDSFTTSLGRLVTDNINLTSFLLSHIDTKNMEEAEKEYMKKLMDAVQESNDAVITSLA